MPRTAPSGSFSGTERHARSPASRATWRKPSQRGSISMSSLMQVSPENAAVPQLPASGPISKPSIAIRYSRGSPVAAAW